MNTLFADNTTPRSVIMERENGEIVVGGGYLNFPEEWLYGDDGDPTSSGDDDEETNEYDEDDDCDDDDDAYLVSMMYY